MIFLRHPRPAVAPGLCYGRLDLAEGPRAGAEIAAALKRMPAIGHVLTRPARRCRRLARRIARAADVAPVEDHRLLELDFGAWEGVAWERIPRAESDPWAEDPWSRAPPRFTVSSPPSVGISGPNSRFRPGMRENMGCGRSV